MYQYLEIHNLLHMLNGLHGTVYYVGVLFNPLFLPQINEFTREHSLTCYGFHFGFLVFPFDVDGWKLGLGHDIRFIQE